MERDIDWRPQILPLFQCLWSDYRSTFRGKARESLTEGGILFVFLAMVGIVAWIFLQQFWMIFTLVLLLWFMMTLTLAGARGLFLPGFLFGGIVRAIGATRRDTRDRIQNRFGSELHTWLNESQGATAKKVLELTEQIKSLEHSLVTLKNGKDAELEMVLTDTGAFTDKRLAVLLAALLKASRGTTASSNLMTGAAGFLGLFFGLMFRDGAPLWVEFLLGAIGLSLLLRSKTRNAAE